MAQQRYPKKMISYIQKLEEQLVQYEVEIARLSSENQLLLKETEQRTTELQIIDNIGQTLAEGRLRYPAWWLDEDYCYGQAVFELKHFSAQWIAQKRMQMYQKFYGARSILIRMLDRQSNLVDHWHTLAYLIIILSPIARKMLAAADG